jgi:hypothetical protein
MPYRRRTISIMRYVSSGRRPVSSVKTRTADEMRDAMSTMTMPSRWKLVAMANVSPNASRAQARISGAVEDSKAALLNNLN